MTPPEKVLDPGPIPYARIDLYGDPDLEHALREEGLDPEATSYRLIEIPVSSIRDTASMPWPRMGTAYVDAIRAGQEFPPIVVFRNQHGWWLLDGVNRTHSHWVLGTVSIRGSAGRYAAPPRAHARQLHMAVVRIWAIREPAGDLCPCPAQHHRAIL